ncbi:MAG: Ig-like domain-containing protein [Nocardioides sp.]|nr:Ig-like domain-containing protein [Nocardioides sp.]
MSLALSRAHLRSWRDPGSAVAAAVLGAALLAGCDAGQALPGAQDGAGSPSAPDAGTASPDESSSRAAEVEATLRPSIANRADGVAVDTPFDVVAGDGTISSLTVTGSGGVGELVGEMAEDRWTATGRLEPGTTYQVAAQMQDSTGDTVTRRTSFSTENLSLDQQTYPSLAPLQGETVGVGMPVVVTFDVPVTDRAGIEEHLSVQTTPAQTGTWRWLSDTEVHYRPRQYWQAGTQVTVDVDINSVPAGNGVYGQESRTVDFTVGDAHIYRVDAARYEMQVFANDELLRTIPITTGKAGFITRSGTKVIVEKFESRRMNSETVGIPAGSADAYDIDDVQYAMRLTYSGEFLHAAPWSVGSQGNANVSHGCTGMSTTNAQWLFELSRRGDVVEYTGTDRPMTLDNGYGDWNESFKQARAESALG